MTFFIFCFIVNSLKLNLRADYTLPLKSHNFKFSSFKAFRNQAINYVGSLLLSSLSFLFTLKNILGVVHQ